MRKTWLGMIAVVSGLVYLVTLSIDVRALRLAAKPVPVLCLAAAVAASGRGPYRRRLAAGLLLSALGDLLLELGERAFLAGLLVFLAAHVAYVAAFVSDERALRPWRGLPFAAYGAGMYLFLLPGLGGLTAPVGVYILAIVAMMWRAAARVAAARPAAVTAVWGAVFFGLSDSLIAIDRFRARVPGARYPIILLYWAGQAGIAASAWRSGRERDQTPVGG